MDRYLFCYDDTAVRGTPVRCLTPRAVIYAASRAEARAQFEEALRIIRPRFGVAGIRREPAREHARLICPCDVLPLLGDYLAQYIDSD